MRRTLLTVAVLLALAAPALGAPSGPYYGSTIADADAGTACFTVSGGAVRNFELHGKLIFPPADGRGREGQALRLMIVAAA